jgi:hypothetical protein
MLQTGAVSHDESTDDKRHQQPTDHQVGKSPPRTHGLRGAQHHHQFRCRFVWPVHLEPSCRAQLAATARSDAETMDLRNATLARANRDLVAGIEMPIL